MPRKSAGKKRVRSSGRSVKRVSRKSASNSADVSKKPRRGLKIALFNLILFAIIFVISIILYSVISDVVLNEFFLMISFLSGFIAVAFLIVTLIFVFLRMVRKR
ncbi:MAG: hypothetical protein AABW50_05645 [Nanoarchaeota archaeon]